MGKSQGLEGTVTVPEARAESRRLLTVLPMLDSSVELHPTHLGGGVLVQLDGQKSKVRISSIFSPSSTFYCIALAASTPTTVKFCPPSNATQPADGRALYKES